MSADAWITAAVIGVAAVVLLLERFPPPVVMLAAVVVLMLTGVLEEDQAFGGFANPAPVTVAALYAIAGAAELTGALSRVTDRMLSSEPGPPRRALTRLIAPTTAASAFIPNTPLVAILAPRVVAWAQRRGDQPSRYLMPLSFAAVLGGVITLIGTSTNLVVSGMLPGAGLDPLGMFEITPVGLVVAAAGTLTLVLTASRLVPVRSSPTEDLEGEVRQYTLEMVVSDDPSTSGRTVASAGLRNLTGVFLAGIEHPDGTSTIPVGPAQPLRTGDRLTFVGDVQRVLDLQRIPGLTSAEGRHLEVLGEGPDRQVYEVVIGDRSALVGSTVKQTAFRDRYGGAVLGVHRSTQRVEGKIGDIRLRAGDVLLVVASEDFGPRWRQHHDFLVVSQVPNAVPMRTGRARWVELALLMVMLLPTFDLLTLTEAAVTVALGLVAVGVLSAKEAARSIDVSVIVIMATSIALGSAAASSGLAGEIGGFLSGAVDLAPIFVLAAVYLATAALTELLSNNAAAALDAPDRALRCLPGRSGATCFRRGRAGGGFLLVPLPHRVPDEHDGVDARRLPRERLHEARPSAHGRHLPDHSRGDTDLLPPHMTCPVHAAGDGISAGCHLRAALILATTSVIG